MSLDPIGELVTQITEGLASLSGAYAAAAGPDLFEAYLLSLVAESARTELFAVGIVNASGGLMFRTGPGRIYGVSKFGTPYTHLQIQRPGCPELEGHVGVRVSGRSQVLHECDVLVIDAAEAQDCRSNRREPRSSRILISAEAKFYSAPLGVDLGRSYIGLISDLTTGFHCLATNVNPSPVVASLMAPVRNREFIQGVLPAGSGVIPISAFFRDAFRRHRDRRR